MFTPSKAEFLKLAEQGNLIPVYAEILADAETPVSAYQKLRKTGPSFLLGISRRRGTHRPLLVSRRQSAQSDSRRPVSWRRSAPAVEQEMAKFRPVSGARACRGSPAARSVFSATSTCTTSSRGCRCPSATICGTPVLCFMITDTILIFDRVSQTIKVVGQRARRRQTPEVPTPTRARRSTKSCADLAANRWRRAPWSFARTHPPIQVDSNMTPRATPRWLCKAKEYIKAGDIIQVVLAQRFQVKTQGAAARHLSGVAVGESVAVHVPARFRGFPARRRVAGGARPLRGAARRDSSHRRHAVARADARGR